MLLQIFFSLFISFQPAIAKYSEPPPGVAPATAMKWLQSGNLRFTTGLLRKNGVSKKEIQRLSIGQRPHSIVLSCSDSRVPPEIVFDQKLGEIFVIRTAGEAIEPIAIASMEFAIEQFGVRNLVVMGHTECGAVKAALATMKGGETISENLDKLVKDIQPRLEEISTQAPSADYSAESWANVNGIIQDLAKRSAIISKHLKTGELKISGALYHLKTGKVDFQQ